MRKSENIEKQKHVLGLDPESKVGKQSDLLHGVWINQLLNKKHWRKVKTDCTSTLEKELRTPNKTTVTDEFVRLCANKSMSSIIS